MTILFLTQSYHTCLQIVEKGRTIFDKKLSKHYITPNGGVAQLVRASES